MSARYVVLLNQLKKTIRFIARRILLYISGRVVLDSAIDIAKYQGLSSAIRYLKTNRYYKPPSVHFAILLYEYLLGLELESAFSRQENNLFIIHFCCWGKDYTEKAKTYLLPSLNTANNLGGISSALKIEILIHCDAVARNELMNSPVVSHLQTFLNITFLVLPQSLLEAYQSSISYVNFSIFKRINTINYNNKYLLLGALQGHALKLGMQYQAYVSFMMPDFLLSEGFFKQAFIKIKDRKVVAMTAFRTDYQAVKKKIDAWSDPDELKTLTIPASTLTMLQIENMHIAAKRRIVSTLNKEFVPSPQLIFEHVNGYIIRAFHYHPILMDCSKISDHIQVDYMPIDYALLNQIVTNEISYEKQIWVCNDSALMSMMELSDADVEGELTFFNKTRSYSELQHEIDHVISKAPITYKTPLNCYFSSIRHLVISDNWHQPGTMIDDVLFFLDLHIKTVHI